MNFLRPTGSFNKGLLLGLGVSGLLPLASRILAGANKPIPKESIKGKLLFMDKDRELYNETRETLSEATHKAKSEASGKSS